MAKKRKTPALAKRKKLCPFHQFSRLPLELRSRIWDLVEPEPRVVELHSLPHEAPAILHVCKESRRSAIKRQLYQRVFALAKRYAWVNFDVDMISIKPIDFSWIKAERELIQRFRFEGENDESFFYFQSKELREFTHLRELHIVCEDGVGYWTNIAEKMGFPTENVWFLSKGPTGTRMCSRQQLFEWNPARPHPEYSNSYYRQLLDKRIKGGEAEIPDDYF